MAKRRSSSDGKKLLAILVMFVIVITPVGQRAYMGVATYISKRIAGSIMHNVEKLPGASPIPTVSSSK